MDFEFVKYVRLAFTVLPDDKFPNRLLGYRRYYHELGKIKLLKFALFRNNKLPKTSRGLFKMYRDFIINNYN